MGSVLLQLAVFYVGGVVASGFNYWGMHTMPTGADWYVILGWPVFVPLRAIGFLVTRDEALAKGWIAPSAEDYVHCRRCGLAIYLGEPDSQKQEARHG